MWVIAPVTERVEVVRGVVAVVEAEAVRLQCVNSVFKDNNPNLLRRVGIEHIRRKLTGTSIKVILDRKSELGSKSSTRACWPQLPIISPIRMIVNGSRKTNSAGLNCHLATRYKHA